MNASNNSSKRLTFYINKNSGAKGDTDEPELKAGFGSAGLFVFMIHISRRPADL